MLFVSALRESLGITLTDENISTAAKLTFWNVALLSLIFTVIDAVRRKLTVERPVKRIVEAAEKIMQGDFSVRVKPQSRFGTDDNFNEVTRCFNRMAEGSRRMAEMMTNILKLNRLENQQIYPRATEFDLGEQLCECLLQFEDVWERAGIELDTDIAEGVRVKADGELLSLVWNNLFSNAFKFTEAGGKVSVSLVTTEHHAIVRVSDTGCGMTREVGAHIFEKFYQGDSSHSAMGNGLGLALVKRVVDIMHGEIGVESTVGVGTTFTVRIRRGL